MKTAWITIAVLGTIWFASAAAIIAAIVVTRSAWPLCALVVPGILSSGLSIKVPDEAAKER